MVRAIPSHFVERRSSHRRKPMSRFVSWIPAFDRMTITLGPWRICRRIFGFPADAIPRRVWC